MATCRDSLVRSPTYSAISPGQIHSGCPLRPWFDNFLSLDDQIRSTITVFTEYVIGVCAAQELGMPEKESMSVLHCGCYDYYNCIMLQFP